MKKIPTFAAAFAVLAITFSLGVWFFVLPVLRTIHDTLGEMDAKNQVKAAPRAQQKQNALDLEQRELVMKLVPAEDEQYDIRIQIEALARTAGVTLSIVDVGSGSTVPAGPPTSQAQAEAQGSTPSLKTIPLNITATGSYMAAQQFVVGLTRLERFIQVDEVNMTSSSNAGDKVSAQIKATTYYLP